MEARFIYRNRSDVRFYDASTREMRGAPDKVIVYIKGVLCAMDHEAKITIPVSRWKLAEIGVACFWAALRGETAAPRSLEAVPVPEPAPEALPPALEATPEPPDLLCRQLICSKGEFANEYGRPIAALAV
jgi:hypothetical protein